MTEKKRYTYIDVSNNDTMGSFFCNGVHLSNQKVVALLNENEQLKSEIKVLRDYGMELLEYINSPPKHRKSILNAVVCFKNKKGDVE